MKAKPSSHTPRLMACVSRLSLRVESSGASSTPMRWSRLVRALDKRGEQGKQVDHGADLGPACGVAGRRFELFHELEPDPTGGVDERYASLPERTLHDGRPPHHVMAVQLGVEVVGEQGRMQEPLGRAASRRPRRWPG